MSPTLVTVLTLVSGISWAIVYIEMIRRGFLDKTYGMPLFALAFNIAWEFMFAFVVPGGLSLQRIVNITWFLLDAVIVYTYFRYGRRDSPQAWQRYFLRWSLLAFAIGFLIIYLMHYEFEDYWGAIDSAFAQNLMMSILFIAMQEGDGMPHGAIVGRAGRPAVTDGAPGVTESRRAQST